MNFQFTYYLEKKSFIRLFRVLFLKDLISNVGGESKKCHFSLSAPHKKGMV